MVFLDLNKRVWRVKDKEFPVIENVPMKELQWFKDISKETLKKSEEGSITQLEAMETDEEWWDRICKVGLNTNKEEIINTGVTSKEFRELMAEVYNFLEVLTNIEEAKLSPLYQVEIQRTDKKPSKTTRNSKNSSQ